MYLTTLKIRASVHQKQNNNNKPKGKHIMEPEKILQHM